MSLAQAKTWEVSIMNFTFTPKNLTINAGDMVNWTQMDAMMHTVTSDDGVSPGFDSGLLEMNETYVHTFDEAGEYPYHCTPHILNPNMHGTITVLAASTNLPVVSLSSPGKGSLYLAPATIVLKASAMETNGAIAHVEFFAGTNLLGMAMESPYSLTWTNVPAGGYVLTAQAFDTNGASATSAPTTVTVATANAYVQHNLVSDLPGIADFVDTNLLNPWGLAFSGTGPFWVADNHTGLSTVYDTAGTIQSLVVAVPPVPGANPPSAPTGLVFNNTTSFAVASNSPARFIFAGEDGTITAWNSGSNAVLKVDNSVSGAKYKGLAIGTDGGADFLYAADFHNGKVDVFDGNYQPVTLAGAFADPNIPAGYAPFGIQNLGGALYVTYALQDEDKEDDVSGPGHGFIDVYTLGGQWVKRYASEGVLNSPWGLTVAPDGFGQWSGALLVGNFGDGVIHAFAPDSGALLGALQDPAGQPISIPGLWALAFGNGGRGGDAGRLYFTAGIAGEGSLEDHGLFGNLSAQATSPAGTNYDVAIHNFAFSPQNLTVHVGDTVTWTQLDTFQHTVTSNDGEPPLFDSGLLSLNQTFAYTFNVPGNFAYYCIPHVSNPKMHGVITVLPAVEYLPVVSLQSLGQGAVYLAPIDFTLVATAMETNGTIARVEFYEGTNLLGTVTQSPYVLTWTNVPPGAYTFTAEAYDTKEASTVSAPVSVAVAEDSAYVQHNLVSDLPGMADIVDTNLLNPWGLAFTGTGPFWIADNHTGLSTIYNTTGAVQTLVVTVPVAAGGTPPSAPTGLVFNNTTSFLATSNLPARFIFSSENGTITAWNSGTEAMLMADHSASNAIYKGLAIGSTGGSNYLYATDFHNGKVDVFDGAFQSVTLDGAFVDPNIPAGYAPFGIQNVGGELYVTYALQDDDKEDDVQGPGYGYVDIYSLSGQLLRRFASEGPLNSPWAVVAAPGSFGKWGGKLLVGNFGDGLINAFDATTGTWLGPLQDGQNQAISIPGLWALAFGNGSRGGDSSRLYFTAGIAGDGSLEDHGLFGSLSAMPATLAPLKIMDAAWQDTGAFHFKVTGASQGHLNIVQASADFQTWTPIATNRATSATWSFTDTGTTNNSHRFYRVQQLPGAP